MSVESCPSVENKLINQRMTLMYSSFRHQSLQTPLISKFTWISTLLDLFKKTGDIKGTFQIGTIKDKNVKDLTEAKEIKKRWQEHTEELYKKRALNDPDNHNGVVTHLGKYVLECEVKHTYEQSSCR